jgi:hypothetical protein
VHGRIASDFGVPQSSGFKIGGSLNGHIGSGTGARVKLNTVNGGIRIYSTMDGRRVLNT